MEKIWPENTPQWLKDAKIENAVFHIEMRFGTPWVIWEAGIWWGGDFWGGDFRGGNFWGGNFRGGDFWGGDFRGGDFWGGDFRGGNFRGGDFRGGDFRGGNFRGGNFRGGNFWGGWWLSGVWHSGKTSPRSKRWPLLLDNGFIEIGCKTKSIKEWDKWFKGKDEFETKRGTVEFKMIYAHYRSVREYKLTMDKK